jgi:cytochrome c oxidase subunit 3
MNTTTSLHPMSKVSTGRIALLVTLGIESVFFLTVLVAYAALREQINWNTPHTLSRMAIPIVNSCILLVSALVAWWSTKAISRDNLSGLRIGLMITLLLGLIFVAGQVYEFSHAGMSVDDQAYGGVFFTLLGFHAVHVLAGVVFLALNLMRANMGDFTADRHEAVELGTWFWFYVTAVWGILFTALYLI